MKDILPLRYQHEPKKDVEVAKRDIVILGIKNEVQASTIQEEQRECSECLTHLAADQLVYSMSNLMLHCVFSLMCRPEAVFK
jgi:hypothetical protein